MRLYFDNRRAQKTVDQKTPGLQAFADLSIVGSGYLQAYWEVDGRVLTPRINRYVHSGKKVTLASPSQNPASPPFWGEPTRCGWSSFPRTTIWTCRGPCTTVTAVPGEDPDTDPADKPPAAVSLWNGPPLPFAWIEEPSLTTYLIEFVEEGQEDPVFSAYVKQGAYTLPQPVLNHYFSPRRTYQWRVRGFDADNNPAGESVGRNFILK
jgi:hypothetical protein